MPKRKKSEADIAFEKLEKKRVKQEAEQIRLNEPVQVFRIVDDKYLYTIREGDIPKPSKGKPRNNNYYNNYESTDHSIPQEQEETTQAGHYKWKIAGIRPQDPEFTKLQQEPRHKCDYCKLKFLHPESLINHMTYTRLPDHPSSVHHGELEPGSKDWEEWKDAFSHSPLRYMWRKKDTGVKKQ